MQKGVCSVMLILSLNCDQIQILFVENPFVICYNCQCVAKASFTCWKVRNLIVQF